MKFILLNCSYYDFEDKQSHKKIEGGKLAVVDEFNLIGEGGIYGRKISFLAVSPERYKELKLTELNYPVSADVTFSPLSNSKSVGQLIKLEDIKPVKLG